MVYLQYMYRIQTRFHFFFTHLVSKNILRFLHFLILFIFRNKSIFQGRRPDIHPGPDKMLLYLRLRETRGTGARISSFFLLLFFLKS